MELKPEHRKVLTDLYLALGAMLLDVQDAETEQPQPQQAKAAAQPKAKRAKAKTTAEPKKVSAPKTRPKSGVGVRALRADEAAKAKITRMLSEGATVNAIATAVGATWEAANKMIEEMKAA